MEVFGIPLGIALGLVIWLAFVRPMQLNEHERRRRAAGLPRKRELPEDRRAT